MKAFLIGATGATGKDLLKLLLNDDEVEQVIIFVRRSVDIKHQKLNVHIINFDEPEQWKSLVEGDVLFSCLGTTLKTAGSKGAQWKIDYEYQYRFAKIAKENNVDNYVLVSAGNASAKSMFFYSRMKGKLEEDVKKLSFKKLIIFKPPLLIRKNSDRKMEVFGTKVFGFFNKMGAFRGQKPLPTKVLATGMLNAVKNLNNGIHEIEASEIRDLAEKGTNKKEVE